LLEARPVDTIRSKEGPSDDTSAGDGSVEGWQPRSGIELVMSPPSHTRRTIPSPFPLPIPSTAARKTAPAAAVESQSAGVVPDSVEEKFNERIAAAIAAGTVNPDEPIVVAVDAEGYVSISNAVLGSPEDPSESVTTSEQPGVNDPVVFSDLHAELDKDGNLRKSLVDHPDTQKHLSTMWGF